MAALATQKPATAGVAVVYSAAAGGGDTFVNNGREMFHVKNGGGSGITVTFNSGAVAGRNKCSFGVANAAHDLAVSVGAGSDALCGPFSKDQFTDGNGNMNVTYSGVTTVTVAVLSAT